MNDLVSVIVPVYKVESYLNKCIESVVNQTYRNLEIILVDDGSPDNCPQMCDEWALKDKRITVIHKQNGGVSSARNIGLAKANGKYISFIDSDDYLDTDFYKILVGDAQNKNSDIVFARYYKVYQDRKVADNERLEEFIESGKWNLLVTDNGAVNAYLPRCLFRRDILNGLQYDESLKYLEDLFLLLNILQRKPIMSCVKIPLYYYVIHESSLCNNVNKNYCNLFEKGAIKCSEKLLDMGFTNEGFSLMYNSYLLAIKQGINLKDKNIINEFDKKYNSNKYYKAYKRCNKTFKSKIKAFCARHRIIWAYKIMLKFLNK